MFIHQYAYFPQDTPQMYPENFAGLKTQNGVKGNKFQNVGCALFSSGTVAYLFLCSIYCR